jgi:hypothetical protein
LVHHRCIARPWRADHTGSPAARAYSFQIIADLWATLLDGGQLSARPLALFISAYTHMVGVCVDVVQLVYKVAGGSTVYHKGPLDRCLRDVLTMSQHVIGTLRTYEMAGRLLFMANQASQLRIIYKSWRSGSRPSRPRADSPLSCRRRMPRSLFRLTTWCRARHYRRTSIPIREPARDQQGNQPERHL